MTSDKLRNSLKEEKLKIDISYRDLSYRKITSKTILKEKIYRQLSSFIETAKIENYPFEFYLLENGHDSMKTIQISTFTKHTGCYKLVPKEDVNGIPYDAQIPIIEEGGSFVISFFITGQISVFIYPRHSSAIKPLEEQLIIINFLDPRKFTDKLLKKSLRKFLFYLRATTFVTVNDRFSIKDRFYLQWLKINDARYKYKFIKSLKSMNNEWGKIVCAAFLAWLVTYLTTATPK